MKNKGKLLAAALCAVIACAGCGNDITANDLQAGTTTTSSVTTAAPETSAPAAETTPAETTLTTTEETTTEETTTTAEQTTTAEETTTTTAKKTETTTTTTTTKEEKKKEEPPAEEEPPKEGEHIDVGTQETRYDSFYNSANTKALYKNAGFSQEQIDFIKNVTFVGDSICSGLKVYNWMPKDQVLAEGCAAARNIFTLHTDTKGKFWFHYGNQKADFKTIYSAAKPKIVVCFMGMNDLNMGSKEQYCERYMKVLDWMHSVTPDAKLYVASITPTNNSGFPNSKIQSFNAAIKQYLADSGKGYGYIDIYSGLAGKSIWGNDGIHLNVSPYGIILKQVCQQLM